MHSIPYILVTVAALGLAACSGAADVPVGTNLAETEDADGSSVSSNTSPAQPVAPPDSDSGTTSFVSPAHPWRQRRAAHRRYEVRGMVRSGGLLRHGSSPLLIMTPQPPCPCILLDTETQSAVMSRCAVPRAAPAPGPQVEAGPYTASCHHRRGRDEAP